MKFSNHPSSKDYAKFEYLYNTFAPKLLGFIMKYTETKLQAEEFLINVYHQVLTDINYFDNNPEKKLLKLVLSMCRPALLLNCKNSNIQLEKA